MKTAIIGAALALGLGAALPAADVHLTTSLDAIAGFQSISIAPSVAFIWQPHVFGVGVEVSVPIGISRGDTYLAALALLKINWLDLGGGISAMLVPPSPGGPAYLYPTNPVLMSFRLGLTAPLFSVGPGQLGFNFSARFLVTATNTSVTTTTPGSLGEAIGQAIGKALADAFAAVANSLKLSAGVSYTLPL